MQACVAVDGPAAHSITDFLTKPTKHRPISGQFYIQLRADGGKNKFSDFRIFGTERRSLATSSGTFFALKRSQNDVGVLPSISQNRRQDKFMARRVEDSHTFASYPPKSHTFTS